MACYHPIPALQDRRGGEVRLHPPLGTANLEIPCGTCLGCRTDHALAWARRAQQEASLWQHNCFLTLTYDEEHLPHHGLLNHDHLTKFLKRLRKAAHPLETAIAGTTTTRWHLSRLRKGHQGPRQLKQITLHEIRYLAAGEYGQTSHRPHYHLLLFNCAFPDQKKVGKDTYESATLAKLWKKGAHRLGTLTGASANYVAQYTLKKIAPDDLARSLNWDRDAVTGLVYNAGTGEIATRPFIRMSKKPPIGNGWLLKYKEDLQHGYLIHHARKEKIPRAIIKQLTKIDPQLAEQATYKASQHKRGHHNREAAEIIHQRYRELTARPTL